MDGKAIKISRTLVDPIANVLLDSASDTAAYSVQFNAQHQMPPNLMAKVQHTRSVIQAKTTFELDDFDLGSSYVEFGRVEFIHKQSGLRLRLRSSSTLHIDCQMTLFDQSKYLLPDYDFSILFFKMNKDGLKLSHAPAQRLSGKKKRYNILGEPTSLGSWSHESGSNFDQGDSDYFDELGKEEDATGSGDE